MTTAKYSVKVLGFACSQQTWDDAFQWDGKGDEVFISVGRKVVDNTGTVRESYAPDKSDVMGDAWQQTGRQRAGSASPAGGIVSGDTFPGGAPWIDNQTAAPGKNYPPYTIWEGDLSQGGNTVFLTPSIWEWDPGNDFWTGLINWHLNTDTQFGQKAKEIYGGQFSPYAWIFDAVSLGIQTVATIPGFWSIGGQGQTRPIGAQRDPNNPKGILFNPLTLALNYDTAESLVNANPFGKGLGILTFRYVDDPTLRGDYSIYVKVEKLSAPGFYPDWSVVRETSDPKVYVIFGKAKFWIPDPPTLNRLYGGWAAVKNVPDGTLAGAGVTDVPIDGTILREEGSAGYWYMQGGTRRIIVPIPYGGSFSALSAATVARIVPDNSLSRFPIGPNLV
jgi:hypothetical protein